MTSNTAVKFKDPATPVVTARCLEVLTELGAGNKRLAAREIKLSAPAVSRILNGVRKPTQAFIARVAGHERVNANYIYYGEGSPLAPIVTAEQERDLRRIYNNAQALSNPCGTWQAGLSAVTEAGRFMSWQLERVFPFLLEGKSTSFVADNKKVNDV
jgi:hypothetical protein